MQGQTPPSEPTPHLAPALTAVILAVSLLQAFGLYARSLESRAIGGLAADEAVIERDGKLAPIKNQGSALQRAALDDAGLLLVYGSSELNLQAAYNRPFHATTMFRDRPTGFTIFPVGKAGTTCLIILQKLAAIGPALRGRKVAISLSPSWFFDRITARADAYAGNFSDLHAGELICNTRLSLRLRQDAARRMLRYPATVANRPLLKFAMDNLAEGSPLGLARYEAVLPLGIAHNAIVGYQDHWGVVNYLRSHPEKTTAPPPAPGGRPIDWPTMYRQADSVYRARSGHNEFGLDDEKWARELRQEMLRLRNSLTDEAFLRTLRANQEWVDLELLLRELNELGAEPMLLSMPIHGGWYEAKGVSSAARRVYYETLREVAARHHAPVVDFADHDADRSFCHDQMGHLAPAGLVRYNRVLDGFFHGVVPPPSELPAASSGGAPGTNARAH